MILIPCKSAMSVIWRVKIPPQITCHISPNTEVISVIWGQVFYFKVFLCVFCALFPVDNYGGCVGKYK